MAEDVRSQVVEAGGVADSGDPALDGTGGGDWRGGSATCDGVTEAHSDGGGVLLPGGMYEGGKCSVDGYGALAVVFGDSGVEADSGLGQVVVEEIAPTEFTDLAYAEAGLKHQVEHEGSRRRASLRRRDQFPEEPVGYYRGHIVVCFEGAGGRRSSGRGGWMSGASVYRWSR